MAFLDFWSAIFFRLPFETRIVLIAAVVAGAVFLFFIHRHMRPKRFYFIRHGETKLNAARIRQGSDGGLTEKGRAQAKKTGIFLKGVTLEHIYASPFERTVETTAIINDFLKLPVTYTLLLQERRNPSEIIGKSYDDPIVKNIINRIDLSYHEDNSHFSDEENFLDLKKRARRCLKYLEKRSGTDFLIVTHGIFLKMLIAYMIHRKRLHVREYVKISYFNPTDNAAITLCEYHPWRRLFKNPKDWHVVSYNFRAPTIPPSRPPSAPITEVFPKETPPSHS